MSRRCWMMASFGSACVALLAGRAEAAGNISWLSESRAISLTHRTVFTADNSFSDSLLFSATGPGDFSHFVQSFSSGGSGSGGVSQDSQVKNGNEIVVSGNFSTNVTPGNTTVQSSYGESTASFTFQISAPMNWSYTMMNNQNTVPSLHTTDNQASADLLNHLSGVLTPGTWVFTASAQVPPGATFATGRNYSMDFVLTPTPEPSLGLVMMAAAGMFFGRRARRCG